MAAMIGSIHQGHKTFANAGRQCVCNSLAAMITSKGTNPQEWMKTDLDNILLDGDKLYAKLQGGKTDEEQLLLISDIPSHFNFNNTNYHLDINKVWCGTLHRNISEKPFMSLEDAIQDINSFCFLTVACYTTAILKSNNNLYVFDPHSRDKFGLGCPDGYAVLTSHKDTASLCQFIRCLAASIISNNSNPVFEVTHVNCTASDSQYLCSEDSDSFEGFSSMSDGEYACRMFMSEEDLNKKVAQINQDDSYDFNSSDSTVTDYVSDSSMHSDSSQEDKLIATKVSLESANAFDFDLNDSFVDKAIQEGLMNESADLYATSLQFDALLSSDEEYDIPLSELKCSVNRAGERLEGERLEGERLEGERMEGERLEGERLEGERLEGERMEGERLEGERLEGERMEGERLEGERMEGERMEGERLEGERLEGEGNLNGSGEHVPRGRKRCRIESAWRRSMSKQNRNAGKSYVSSYSKQRVRAKSIKKGCGGTCRYKCHEKVTEEQRQTIFREFWALGNIDRQRDYISNWVSVQPKKVKINSVRSPPRKFSRRWQFKIDGIFITVCKTFFLHTLDISHTAVETAIKKSNSETKVTGIVSPDKRGKYLQRKNKTAEEAIANVHSHIESFPRVESHYCRKDSNKLYLEPGLTITNMYSLYLDYCTNRNLDPVSIGMYRHVFNHSFNLGFHKPTKDRCDLCSRYENLSDSDRKAMENEYQTHITNKNLMRKSKELDKIMAKSNSNLTVACFDLQQVLLTPKSNESSMYYTRKLSTFNLTVYDIGSKEGYSYIWNENDSGRGANEIASAMYLFLREQSKKHKNEIILYSDSCGGQNKNRHFFTMLCYAQKQLKFKKIQHKFLERGHTQNENDSIHACIENKSRHISIYTTPQWAAVVRTARKNPYQVRELSSSDFLDFKKVSNVVPNLDYDVNGDKLMWQQMQSVSVESEEDYTVNIKYRDQGSTSLNIAVRPQTRSKSKQLLGFKLPEPKPLYLSAPLPKLSADKYKDLMKLCEDNLIPKVHHPFFSMLRHETDAP